MTTLDIARGYIARGWSPVPIPYREKNPGFKDWQKLRLTTATVDDYFNGDPANIGILLGAPSGGLVDVDLDCDEALAVASYFLPSTELMFGRMTNLDSHWLYDAGASAGRTLDFNDPDRADDEARILELRANGGQTVFPGSTHRDTAEVIEWSGSADAAPAKRSWAELTGACRKIAIAVVLIRHWVKGTRDDLCAATVGVLLRAGWPDDDIANMLEAIAEAADDEKVKERIEKIGRLREQLTLDGPVPGLPKLAELTSDKVAASIKKWTGYKEQSTPDSSQLEIARMSDIEQRELEWLVPGGIALGKPTLWVGDPGLGKSLITIDLVAAITTGARWPWLGCMDGDVVLLSAEDDPEDTIAPRLAASGADLKRVFIIRSVRDLDKDGNSRRRAFNLVRDVARLEAELKARPGVRLAVIDPISAYMGGTDSHVNTSVREALAPLADTAARCRCAIVVVSHLNKNAGGTGNVLYRVTGSLAFTAAARAVYAVLEDPLDDNRRLFLSAKNNLAKEASGFAYRIVEQQKLPRVEWEQGNVSMTAGQAMTRTTKHEDNREVDDWLKERLGGGPKPADTMWQEAKANGFSRNRVFKAHERLGVRTKQEYREDGRHSWMWSILPTLSKPGTLGTLGTQTPESQPEGSESRVGLLKDSGTLGTQTQNPKSTKSSKNPKSTKSSSSLEDLGRDM